jgi:transposase
MQKAFLSDKQGYKTEPVLSKLRNCDRPLADNRRVLEGIIWVFKTQARWRDLPKEYPSASTCWRRLR